MGKQRSDVPYVIRLMEKKIKEIGREREDAAMTALEIMLITLADDFGFGLERLTRLGRKTGDQIREYYASQDPEVEQHHLQQRLEQIGFTFGADGKLLAHVNPETNKPERRKINET